ncbi:MAG: phenylalanine--tRNA ligase subunit beta [Bacteroidales bacterium]|nr:phenylalanine--tRNA ligase subunit beta [Bacteroidales bacterium]
MKISYSWLQQYIDIDIDPNELSVLLTDGGLEVEGLEKVESIKGGLQGIKIGKVLSCEKHENADKLSVTRVDIGTDTPLPIVCGAPNVAKGQNVLVATVGTVLYDGDDSFKIKKSKIRGEVSEGMICAEDELGLGTSHNGIMVLPEDVTIGSDARTYFNITDDWVYEIGLTPNRADATSHIGSARDLVAVINRFNPTQKISLKIPDVSTFKVDDKKGLDIDINIENNIDCSRYSGICISNVEVKESPEWLQNRLKSIGLRPINNIVDVTNYVLMETGHPLHAFDYDKIEGKKVVIKNLAAGTKFITLDDAEHKLNSKDLMICNEKEAMCFAGVFGGKGFGVENNTTNIFLESAYFDSVAVRKTSKLHNLKTDASFRFERGADPNITVYALKRTALLIKEIAGGTIASEIIDIYPKPIEKWKIELRFKQLERMIGQVIPTDMVKSILLDLDIEIEKETELGLSLIIPTFKVDVTREADIIEEVLRVFGYNQIELSDQIHSSISYSNKPDLDKITNLVSEFLTAKSYSETMNNSLTKQDYYIRNAAFDENKSVKILNPLSSELNVLRQNLIFGGLETISRNIKHRNSDVKIFEFGNQYTVGDADSKNVTEHYLQETHLGIFLSGNKTQESWSIEAKNTSFFDLKSVLQELLQKLGIKLKDIRLVEFTNETYSYGLELKIKKNNFALIGKLNKSICNQFDIEQDVFYSDINWTKLFSLLQNYKVKYQEISKYPAVRRDLALLIDKDISFSAIETNIRNAERNLLKGVNLFDVYEGKGVAKGKKSYAISIMLQDANKTLNDKIIEKSIAKIFKSLEREFNAELR